MGYFIGTGYVPDTFESIMDIFRQGVNDQFGTTYIDTDFAGTNFYKFYYPIAQRTLENETTIAEIFVKMTDYFDVTNETILNPKVTPNGIIDALLANDFIASVKPMEVGDAGTANICVDVDETDDEYAATKLEICTLIKDYVVAGVFTGGTETEELTLTNGQAVDFSFHLPDVTEVLLRLTLTTSRNNQAVIGDPEDSKTTLLANIAAEYSLGRDFEPERYFTKVDAPWCSDILLEYSLNDGADWLTDVYESEYNEKFTFALEDVTLIEA